MTKFDWNDITIIPDTLSDISSRSEIDIFLKNGNLPIFTAPMDMVIDEDNIKYFTENKINVCLPRNIKYDINKSIEHFYSYGLDEIIDIFENNKPLPRKVLIDIANGHLTKLYNISNKIKEKFGDNIELMVGNIANPETYRKYCEIGVDYIRVGIGGGCFTPDSLVLTNIGYKAIKDINIGDMVLTHKNRYKEVLHKFIYNKNEEIFKINDIKCTKNHEFYVIEKSNKHIVNDDNIEDFGFWIKAEELNKDIHLLVKY
jgi:hypothetical protein